MDVEVWGWKICDQNISYKNIEIKFQDNQNIKMK